jgi:hypothetical protein
MAMNLVLNHEFLVAMNKAEIVTVYDENQCPGHERAMDVLSKYFKI